jgi:hypothetical protein
MATKNKANAEGIIFTVLNAMALIRVVKCDVCGWCIELDERIKLPHWFSQLYRRYWRLRDIIRIVIRIDLSRNVRW